MSATEAWMDSSKAKQGLGHQAVTRRQPALCEFFAWDHADGLNIK